MTDSATKSKKITAIICADEAQRTAMRLVLQQHGFMVMSFNTPQRFAENCALGGEQPERVVLYCPQGQSDVDFYLDVIQNQKIDIPTLALFNTPPERKAVKVSLPIYNTMALPLNPDKFSQQLQAEPKAADNEYYTLPQNALALLRGHSQPVNTLRHHVMQAINTTANVLIEGECPSIRKLIALHIHENSSIKDKPFIYINCAGLPPQHAQDILFNNTGRESKFAEADQGTLVLDEIETLSSDLQVQLLEMLQSQQQKPARLICGSSHEMMQHVHKGTFREDLFYAIAVLSVQIPSIRERKSDFKHIVNHIIEGLGIHKNGEKPAISFASMELLKHKDWPGSINQLQHVLMKALVRSHNGTILPEHLYPFLQDTSANKKNAGQNTITPLEDIERKHILMALEICNGSISTTARRLKIGRATLYRKLSNYKDQGLLPENLQTK